MVRGEGPRAIKWLAAAAESSSKAPPMIKQGLAFSKEAVQKSREIAEVKVFPRSSSTTGMSEAEKAGEPLPSSITVNNRQGRITVLMMDLGERPPADEPLNVMLGGRLPEGVFKRPTATIRNGFKVMMPCCCGDRMHVAGFGPVASQALKREPSPNIGRSGRQAYGIFTG